MGSHIDTFNLMFANTFLQFTHQGSTASGEGRTHKPDTQETNGIRSGPAENAIRQLGSATDFLPAGDQRQAKGMPKVEDALHSVLRKAAEHEYPS